LGITGGKLVRQAFQGYYPLSSEKIRQIWDQGTFCFDANVLLNLYRYSAKTRDEFLAIVRGIADRIWIPHQAAFEFHQNRPKVIIEQTEVFEGISKTIEKTRIDLFEQLRGEHPSLDGEKIVKDLDRAFLKAIDSVMKARKNHPDFLKNDPIVEKLFSLLEGRVGLPFSQEQLLELYMEGKDRYERKLPPGFCDAKKGDMSFLGTRQIQNRYGDLILWKQLIAFFSDSTASSGVILVTDDIKDDWWRIVAGRRLGPRPELVTEFSEHTGKPFIMYRTESFLEHAHVHLKAKVTKKTLSEVRYMATEKIDWRSLVVDALISLGGSGSLPEIYEYIYERRQTFAFPASWQSSVRTALYSRSSDVGLYAGKEDLFHHAGRGLWALRNTMNMETSNE
jgi:hypothetical protein